MSLQKNSKPENKPVDLSKYFVPGPRIKTVKVKSK
jgi:hypothetical protein